MEYLQSSKYTKSMSQLITDSPSVMEMKLRKMEPWPLDEFEKQFDLQSIFRMLFSKYRLNTTTNATWHFILMHMVKDTVSPELLKD
jgi:hypothetical protein